MESGIIETGGETVKDVLMFMLCRVFLVILLIKHTNF